MIYPRNFVYLNAKSIQNASYYKHLLTLRKRRRRYLRSCSKYATKYSNGISKRRTKQFNNVSIDGVFQKMDPKETYWYKNYVLFPNLESPAFQAKFRCRFRLSHHSFLSLLKKVSTSPLFQRWDLNKMRHHITQTSPLSLLLLGSLRYLGWG